MKGRKTLKIDDVQTTNYPYEVIDGEEHYNLHAGVVVEHIVKHIPPEAKPAVIIDYEKIPESFHQMVNEKMGLKPVDEEEAKKREQKLVQVLTEQGMFPQEAR